MTQKEVVVNELSDKRAGAKSLKPGMTKPNIVKLTGNRVRRLRKLSAFHRPRTENKPDKKQRRLIHRCQTCSDLSGMSSLFLTDIFRLKVRLARSQPFIKSDLKHNVVYHCATAALQSD